MDGAEVAVLAQAGERLWVLFFSLPQCRVLSLTDLSRLALKVVIQSPNACGTRRKLTRAQLCTVVFDFLALLVGIRLPFDTWR